MKDKRNSTNFNLQYESFKSIMKAVSKDGENLK